VGGGDVTRCLGCLEDGGDNFFEDDVGNFGGRGVVGNRQAMYAKRVGTKGLVEAIHFLRQLVDDDVLLSELLAEGSILVYKLSDGLLEGVDLG